MHENWNIPKTVTTEKKKQKIKENYSTLKLNFTVFIFKSFNTMVLKKIKTVNKQIQTLLCNSPNSKGLSWNNVAF